MILTEIYLIFFRFNIPFDGESLEYCHFTLTICSQKKLLNGEVKRPKTGGLSLRRHRYVCMHAPLVTIYIYSLKLHEQSYSHHCHICS